MGNLMWWQNLELGYEGSGFVNPDNSRSASDQLRENFSRAFLPDHLTEWFSPHSKAVWMESTQILDFAELITGWLLDARTLKCPPLRARRIYLNFECYMEVVDGLKDRAGPVLRPKRNEDKPPGIKCRMKGGEWRDSVGFYLEARRDGQWDFWDGKLLEDDLQLEAGEQGAILASCNDGEYLPSLVERESKNGDSDPLLDVFVTATLVHSCPS